jgi:hypothetical protein
VREFRDVRRRIVHGSDVSGHEVLRAIDLGSSILQALRRVPREVHVVVAPSVESSRTKPRDVRAVLLESTNLVDRRPGSPRAFPTRRDYKKGQTVSWEWKFDTIWDESWYRDPDTGQIAYAWTSSAEFDGRPLKSLKPNGKEMEGSGLSRERV